MYPFFYAPLFSHTHYWYVVDRCVAESIGSVTVGGNSFIRDRHKE